MSSMWEITLQSTDLHFSYQWIFITDTVDAIYRPDNWSPEAMMDQLADVTGNLPIGVSTRYCKDSLIFT